MGRSPIKITGFSQVEQKAFSPEQQYCHLIRPSLQPQYWKRRMDAAYLDSSVWRPAPKTQVWHD
jgi:hypothetical protein